MNRRFRAALLLLLVAASGAASAQERINEIRIHGNHTTPDADVLALSGLTVGLDAAEARLRDAEEALRASRRFAAVQIVRRFRSLDDPTDILVVIQVDEHAAVRDDDLTPGWARRLRSAGMWLPILAHADNYGLTYGARAGFANAFGDRSRLSVPLSWGGERRAGVEMERAWETATLRGALSVYRRVNPHFDLPDLRREARVEADRGITRWLRAGANARLARVDFGDAYEARHVAAGPQLTIDTRIDPSFPRNAIHARIGWEHMTFGGRGGRAPALPGRAASAAHRWLLDGRGYIGVGGPAVLALRGHLAHADRALPAAEQPLLGGSDSLRGYRAGHRAGDSMAAISAEVRLPLNSPLSVARFGVKAFTDAGTTWDAGERLRDQRFDRGVGAGLYVGAAALLADLDIAWPERGKSRVHFGVGISF